MNDRTRRRREHREASTSRRQDGRVGVAMVGMAVVVWWPAFTLGAWGDLFFDQLLAVWAAATAAFVFVAPSACGCCARSCCCFRACGWR